MVSTPFEVLTKPLHSSPLLVVVNLITCEVVLQIQISCPFWYALTFYFGELLVHIL